MINLYWGHRLIKRTFFNDRNHEIQPDFRSFGPVLGSRMRNYVSESPVTIQNNQAVIYLSGCFDKEENLYNKTY